MEVTNYLFSKENYLNFKMMHSKIDQSNQYKAISYVKY